MTLEELIQRVNQSPVKGRYKASRQHTGLQRTWPSEHEYDFGTLVEDVAAHLDGLDGEVMRLAIFSFVKNIDRDRMAALNRRLSLSERYLAAMQRYHHFKRAKVST